MSPRWIFAFMPKPGIRRLGKPTNTTLTTWVEVDAMVVVPVVVVVVEVDVLVELRSAVTRAWKDTSLK